MNTVASKRLPLIRFSVDDVANCRDAARAIHRPAITRVYSGQGVFTVNRPLLL